MSEQFKFCWTCRNHSPSEFFLNEDMCSPCANELIQKAADLMGRDTNYLGSDTLLELEDAIYRLGGRVEEA